MERCNNLLSHFSPSLISLRKMTLTSTISIMGRDHIPFLIIPSYRWLGLLSNADADLLGLWPSLFTVSYSVRPLRNQYITHLPYSYLHLLQYYSPISEGGSQTEKLWSTLTRSTAYLQYSIDCNPPINASNFDTRTFNRKNECCSTAHFHKCLHALDDTREKTKVCSCTSPHWNYQLITYDKPTMIPSTICQPHLVNISSVVLKSNK